LRRTQAKTNLSKFLKSQQKVDILSRVTDEANAFLQSYQLPVL
jgi:hypothetical protein